MKTEEERKVEFLLGLAQPLPPRTWERHADSIVRESQPKEN